MDRCENYCAGLYSGVVPQLPHRQCEDPCPPRPPATPPASPPAPGGAPGLGRTFPQNDRARQAPLAQKSRPMMEAKSMKTWGHHCYFQDYLLLPTHLPPKLPVQEVPPGKVSSHPLGCNTLLSRVLTPHPCRTDQWD